MVQKISKVGIPSVQCGKRGKFFSDSENLFQDFVLQAGPGLKIFLYPKLNQLYILFKLIILYNKFYNVLIRFIFLNIIVNLLNNYINQRLKITGTYKVKKKILQCGIILETG